MLTMLFLFFFLFVFFSPPFLRKGKFAKKVRKQKEAWCKEHLGPEVEVITCMTSEKHLHSAPNHVLIDDRLTLKAAWEAKGGTFVHHQSLDQTIAQLVQLIISPSERSDAQALAVAQLHALPPLPLPDPNVVWVEGPRGLDEMLAALRSATVVAIDAEWRPDELVPEAIRLRKGRPVRSAVAVLQLATSSEEAFVVDMLHLSVPAQEAIRRMFANPEVLKVGFGLEQDVLRLTQLAGDLQPVLDLQRALPALIPGLAAVPTLTAVVERVMQTTMVKVKAVQASDWEARPLTAEQLRYAGLDAAVLQSLLARAHQADSIAAALQRSHQVLQVAKPRDCIFSSRANNDSMSAAAAAAGASAASVPSETAASSSSSHSVLFTSVLLSPEARAAVLAAFPPRHIKLLADHVTLAYKPGREQLDGVPLGSTVTIEALADGERHNGSVQCVAVRVPELDQRFLDAGRFLHITISAAPGTEAKEANALLSQAPPAVSAPASLVLHGTVAAHLTPHTEVAQQDTGLSRQLAQRLRDFSQTSQVL